MKTLYISIIIAGFISIGIMLPDALADVKDSSPVINETQIQLKVNQTIESDNIKIKFLNVTEDSRCPTGVTCIWEGQVKIAVNIIKNDKNLGNFVLTSRSGQPDMAIQTFDGRSIQVVKVNPYPTSGRKISLSDYVATFIMSNSSILSPLNQFKSGITANNVKCEQGLQLVIKSEDGSPACVKPETAYVLINHGWAKEFIQSSVMFNQSMCDGTKVPSGDYRANIFPVLLMQPNSTATVCVTYNFNIDWKSYPNKEIYPHGILETCCFVHMGKTHEPTLSNQFEVLATPPLYNVTGVYNGSNITVIYKIHAGSNSKGFYDTSIPFGFCISYPLAVGYSPSEVDATDFNAEFDIPCFNAIESVDSVKIVSGMTYKEVQFP
jgi:hypothetical protein